MKMLALDWVLTYALIGYVFLTIVATLEKLCPFVLGCLMYPFSCYAVFFSFNFLAVY